MTQRDLVDVNPPHPLKLLLGLLRIAAPVDGSDTEDEWLVEHSYLKEVKLRNKGTKLEPTTKGITAAYTAARFLEFESSLSSSNVSESSSSQGKT